MIKWKTLKLPPINLWSLPMGIIMLTKHEKFVADWFLSEYPKDKTFEELCTKTTEIVKDTLYQDDFLIWYPFEQEEDLGSLMYDMLEALQETFE